MPRTGVGEREIDLQFPKEAPNDWPPRGSSFVDHSVESQKNPEQPGGHGFFDYADERKKRGDKPVKIRMHVWNGEAGKPTVAYFYGSMMCWDGSSNFNFNKELMSMWSPAKTSPRR